MMCNAVFGKTMQNGRSGKDIKLVTTDTQRNKLVSQPNFYSSKWLSNNTYVSILVGLFKTKVQRKFTTMLHGY